MAKTYVSLTKDRLSELINEHNSLVNKVGDLSLLSTTQDSSIVGAINEQHLDSSIITNLANIDSATTISAQQWTWLGALDQSLATTDSVGFERILIGNGAVHAPSIAFDSDDGFYRKSGSQIGVSINKTEVWDWGSVSHQSKLPILVVADLPGFVVETTDGTSGHERSAFGRDSDQMSISTQTTGATIVQRDMVAPVSANGILSWEFRTSGTPRFQVDSEGINVPTGDIKREGYSLGWEVLASVEDSGTEIELLWEGVNLDDYQELKVWINDVVVDSAGVDLVAQISDTAASGFFRSGSDYLGGYYVNGKNTQSYINQTYATLFPNVRDGTDAQAGVFGEVNFRKSTSSKNVAFKFDMSGGQDSSVVLANVVGGASWTGTGSGSGVDGLRILTSSGGNISSARMQVLGLRK